MSSGGRTPPRPPHPPSASCSVGHADGGQAQRGALIPDPIDQHQVIAALPHPLLDGCQAEVPGHHLQGWVGGWVKQRSASAASTLPRSPTHNHCDRAVRSRWVTGGDRLSLTPPTLARPLSPTMPLQVMSKGRSSLGGSCSCVCCCCCSPKGSSPRRRPPPPACCWCADSCCCCCCSHCSCFTGSQNKGSPLHQEQQQQCYRPPRPAPCAHPGCRWRLGHPAVATGPASSGAGPRSAFPPLSAKPAARHLAQYSATLHLAQHLAPPPGSPHPMATTNQGISQLDERDAPTSTSTPPFVIISSCKTHLSARPCSRILPST